MQTQPDLESNMTDIAPILRQRRHFTVTDVHRHVELAVLFR